MVKVIDPDGIVIGVYESMANVPLNIPSRFCTHSFSREDCEIVEVTDPKDMERLRPTMERLKRERE